MIELIESNWALVALAVLLGLFVAWFVFRASRRTRVSGTSRDVLDEGAARAARNSSLIDAPSPAADPPIAPVTTPAGLAGAGTAVAAGSEAMQAQASGVGAPTSGDDLSRIKGLGPKLAARLQELGVTTFAQIAAWDDSEIDRIDGQLGRFQGRIRRDDWVGQAKLLGADDLTGYADKYGRVG